MPGEQEHHISSVPFFFFITYKFLTCERRLYLPFTTYKSTTESATLRPLNSGYGMSAYEGMAKINLHSQSKLIITSVNQF